METKEVKRKKNNNKVGDEVSRPNFLGTNILPSEQSISEVSTISSLRVTSKWTRQFGRMAPGRF